MENVIFFIHFEKKVRYLKEDFFILWVDLRKEKNITTKIIKSLGSDESF